MDETKRRQHLETAVAELRARNAVYEAVLSQILLRFASLYEPPQEALREIMIKAEDSLRNTRKNAQPGEAALAADAVEIFNEYSARLIAAITPNTTKN
jgi:hypothetical protein